MHDTKYISQIYLTEDDCGAYPPWGSWEREGGVGLLETSAATAWIIASS